MARKSPARGFKPDGRASPGPFAKADDINSLKFEGYRPATVQELIEKKKIEGNSRIMPSKSFKATLPQIGRTSPTNLAPLLPIPSQHSNPPIHAVPSTFPPAPNSMNSKQRDGMTGGTPVAIQDTVNMLEQLDGPSRELPGGARPSAERPATGQEMSHTLNPNNVTHGIPRLGDNEGKMFTTAHSDVAARTGGAQMSSFGTTRRRHGKESPFSKTMGSTQLTDGDHLQRSRSTGSKMKSPPRLRQAIEGTPFTAARPDQPYFPFLLANLGAPRMTQERESVIKDQLKDYAMLAVAWQRSRAGTTGSGKTAAAINAEHKFLVSTKKAMRRELDRLHLGDYSQEPYRRTHVVDPADSGLVFFKMATAYDELRDLKNALRCAKLYLNVCRQMGDTIGEALACNNIGVQYQTLGGKRNLSKAVSYHSLHLQNGDDLGRFIAYLNLGHAYREMGMVAQSRESTQKALECAQRAYSAFGESIACAQLGETMRVVGDRDASRNFLEQWLELSENMQDQRSEEQAWAALGSLQQASSKYEDAADCYTHAYELALARHDNHQTDHARALVGVTKGCALVSV